MKKATEIILLIWAVCFVACSKDDETPSQTNTIRGSWKYIGYSGGLAGLPFTLQDSVTYFLQFDANRYTSIRNNVQGCGVYTFEKDSVSNLPHVGLLYLSGENYPNKFDTYLKNDTLTLYPHGMSDGFSYSFVYSLKQFDWCDSTEIH